MRTGCCSRRRDRAHPLAVLRRDARIPHRRALPFRRGGAVVGALNFYAEGVLRFDAATICTLEEIGRDLSHALDNYAREAARVSALAALRASEHRYEELVERIPQGVFSLQADAAGGRHFTYTSRRFREILGLPLEVSPADAEDVAARVLPADREQLRTRWAATKALVLDGRFMLQAAGRWVRFAATPYANACGPNSCRPRQWKRSAR